MPCLRCCLYRASNSIFDVDCRNQFCETRANHDASVTRASVQRECLTTFDLSPTDTDDRRVAALPVMAPSHHSWHGMLLALMTVPPILFAVYFFSQFPRVPDAIEIHPSLASLFTSHRVAQIYPEDIYEGGAYFDTPHGRVRAATCLWFTGYNSSGADTLLARRTPEREEGEHQHHPN